tara:strand:+ start:347 stop:496 length:150 start_codon:yes stop_codon:yes gene_type:complete
MKKNNLNDWKEHDDTVGYRKIKKKKKKDKFKKPKKQSDYRRQSKKGNKW